MLIILVIRDMQINHNEIPLHTHYLDGTKKTGNNSVGKDMDKWEPLYKWLECKMMCTLGNID